MLLQFNWEFMYENARFSKRTPSYLEEMELAVVDSEEGTFAFFVSVFYDEG